MIRLVFSRKIYRRNTYYRVTVMELIMYLHIGAGVSITAVVVGFKCIPRRYW